MMWKDALYEAELHLIHLQKKNSKRLLRRQVFYLMSFYRHTVETTGSMKEQILPKHIHTVTPAGFELKVALFVLA